mgnify:CR=1 FL=1
MSSSLDDSELAAIAMLLSLERLSALQDLTGSTRAAIELHQETLRLGSRLLNVIASIELAIRNSVSENLSAHFGTARWLTHPPAPFQWRPTENEIARKALDSAQRAEYAKASAEQRAILEAQAFPRGRPPNTSHIKRAKERRRQIVVSEGKVIAETTFYFWKRLYSGDYEQSLWRTTLKRTFPNKLTKRAQVAAQLEHIYQARNRLAHHEPVLHKRFRDAITAIDFVVCNLGSSAPSFETPLAKLLADDLILVRESAEALHSKLDAYRSNPGRTDR